MKKLFPFVFLLIGTGAGVGAGIFLRPLPVDEPVESAAPAHGEDVVPEEEHSTGGHKAEETDTGHNENAGSEAATNEYVKLSNQFVIPIVVGEKVTALVVLAFSIEVPEGKTDTVYLREPKLRDSFLQVLFDHANMGGFEGNFTDAQALGRLRTSLKEVGQRDLGKDLVKDVLIVEIARQDY